MKCKRLRTEALRNEEWFQFYTEFLAVVRQHDPKMLEIGDLFTTFLSLYANADEALEVIRKSATTEQLAEADSVRDGIFRGFAYAVKSALNHFDTKKRDAANRLQIVFDQFGNIARKPYDEETAAIYNFLQEMNALSSEVTLLGLTDWTTQLETENKAFNELMKNRYDESASRTALRMKEVRTETDRCYRDILDRIDALMIVKGETDYLPFVKDMSVRVERFDNMLAQRKGRAKKDEKPVESVQQTVE